MHTHRQTHSNLGYTWGTSWKSLELNLFSSIIFGPTCFIEIFVTLFCIPFVEGYYFGHSSMLYLVEEVMSFLLKSNVLCSLDSPHIVVIHHHHTHTHIYIFDTLWTRTYAFHVPYWLSYNLMINHRILLMACYLYSILTLTKTIFSCLSPCALSSFSIKPKIYPFFFLITTFIP